MIEILSKLLDKKEMSAAKKAHSIDGTIEDAHNILIDSLSEIEYGYYVWSYYPISAPDTSRCEHNRLQEIRKRYPNFNESIFEYFDAERAHLDHAGLEERAYEASERDF